MTAAQRSHVVATLSAMTFGAACMAIGVGIALRMPQPILGICLTGALFSLLALLAEPAIGRQPFERTLPFAQRVLAQHGLTCESRWGGAAIAIDGLLVEVYALDERDAAAALLRRADSVAPQPLAPWSAGGPH